jgi:hypothetical protein
MSGYSEDIRTADGFLEDGVELLRKPFTGQQLLTKVRHLLDRTGGAGKTGQRAASSSDAF